MKRWPFLAVAFFVLFVGSVATALAPDDLLPGEVAAVLAAPSPIASGEVDRTGYIKGFYVSGAALGSADFVARMEELLETTELNGVVLDFKTDRGYLTFPTNVPLAQEIGADQAPLVKDPAPLLNWFKERDVYTIARIVAFKDNVLANAYPGWAVMDANTGGVWHDHEGMGWIDGMQAGAWDYNVQLALEAAQMGFDEIQYDYVRFPTDGNVSGARFSQANTYENRTNAIVGLLQATKTALTPTGAKLGVDVFGYTAWVSDDLGIGQHLEALAPYVDVIAPMVYPSTFNAGLPGEDPKYQNTIAYPYEVIRKSTERAVTRLRGVNPDLVVRPWLQDFKDYAFDGRTYTAAEIRRQIDGAREGGARGWLLWDPLVRYTRPALVSADPSYRPDTSGQVPVLVYREPPAAASDPAIAAQSAAALRADLEWLRQQGFYPASLTDLAAGQLRSVPAGKRAVVLTFDGASPSQFRMVEGGAVDPDCTVGVLVDYNNAHPADWPLRGAFFVTPTGETPGDAVFGTATLAEFKLQMLISWGFEIAIRPVEAETSDHLDDAGVQQALGQAQQLLSGWLPGYEAQILQMGDAQGPHDPAFLAAGAWKGALYTYAGAVLPAGGLAPSPRSAEFNPYRIPRIPAGVSETTAWHKTLLQSRLYVSGGE